MHSRIWDSLKSERLMEKESARTSTPAFRKAATMDACPSGTRGSLSRVQSIDTKTTRRDGIWTGMASAKESDMIPPGKVRANQTVEPMTPSHTRRTDVRKIQRPVTSPLSNQSQTIVRIHCTECIQPRGG